MPFKRVFYSELNGRQQENFNFQKLAGHLADFGFKCMWLNDDWQGADFIACHIDGIQFLKVQLKSRLTIDRRYSGKDIHIAFFWAGTWYVYPHDEVRDLLLTRGDTAGSRSWRERGAYSWPRLSAGIVTLLRPYAVE